MGAVFRWIKYIYEWCRDFALRGGVGVGGGMPHGGMGGPIGNIFYVNGGADGTTVGLNTNPGTKAQPFLTIAHALTHCVSGHDDYIICWNTRHQDEAATIEIGIDNVHIIGVALPSGSSLEMETTGDYPAILVGPGSEHVEIAGFNLAGGTNHACIELSSGNNHTWIHNCSFGHQKVPAAQDGIRCVVGGGTNFGTIIENCWFFGNVGPDGKLTRYGIWTADLGCGEWTIRNNYFLNIPTCAISLGTLGGGAAHEHVVDHNCIACGADALGNAITLGNTSDGCLVQNNEAAHGSGTLMTAAPYSDTQAGDENHWVSNQAQDQMVLPDEVPH